jgi:peroxiredoxin Q/BCP
MLKVGSMAPDFSLPDQTGSIVSLADYLGKWVLLYFYPKDNTPGCTTEACGIRDAWQDFKAAGITVVGVSGDSVKRHQKFIAEFHLPFTLLSDKDRAVIGKYGALGEKTMYGKKYMGILRVSYLLDPSGKIRAAYPKVDPATHAEQILKDFASLKK